MLAFWLTYVYFNIDSNNVNKKMTKKALFWAILLLRLDFTKELLDSRIAGIRIDPYIVSMSGT